MIIFDLDGTLADCSHRRHFVDPDKIPEVNSKGYNTITGEKFEPNWKSFFEACDKDGLIIPAWTIFRDTIDAHSYKDVQIWSGRCESVREKTERWLMKYYSPATLSNFPIVLKMRPIGDNTPDDQLKERWLDEALSEGKIIEFVFDDRKKVLNMWIRRDIFVFDVSQGNGNF